MPPSASAANGFAMGATDVRSSGQRGAAGAMPCCPGASATGAAPAPGSLARIKLIASDLDGTLVNSADVISAHSAAVLRRAMDAGYYVTYLTGRTAGNLDRVYRDLHPNAPVVCSNGAQVADATGARLITAHYIPPDTLRALAIFLRWHGMEYIVRCDEFGVRNMLADDPRIAALKVVKVMISLHDGADRYLPALRRYCARSAPVNLTVSGDGMLEASPAGVDKGTGLREVCRMLGFDPAECLVFGDFGNDVPSFDVAGVAVCTANGSDEAKAHATYICATNDEDGVAAFVAKYLLGAHYGSRSCR